MSRASGAPEVRRVGTRAEVLAAYGEDPVLRWDLPATGPAPGWVATDGPRRAVLVARTSHTGQPGLLALGHPGATDVLLARLVATGDLPAATRITVAAGLLEVVAARLPLGGGGDWDWMWTTTAPPRQPGEDGLVVPGPADVAALAAFLAAHNARTDARPGEHTGERWLAARDGDGGLLACGARVLTATGVPVLEGITTAAAARGRGLASAVVAGLTRDAVAGHGVCLLGTYADDPGPGRLYRRLGYAVAQRLCSRRLPG